MLWEAFQQDIVPKTVPGSTLAEIRALGMAVAQLAEEQMKVEVLAMSNAERLNRTAQVVQRLVAVERRLAPPAYVTEEQAATISLQVKALAELLTREVGDKNYYQSIFAELYRRFGVSSYKNLRREQYEAVLGFLEDWRRAATGRPPREMG